MKKIAYTGVALPSSVLFFNAFRWQRRRRGEKEEEIRLRTERIYGEPKKVDCFPMDEGEL